MKRKKNKRKKYYRHIIRFTIIGILVLAGTLMAATFYMLDYSLSPDPNRLNPTAAYRSLYQRVPDMQQWVDSLQKCGLLRDTFVTMPSGECHHAYYLPSKRAQGRTAIVVHGYRDSALKFMYLGRMYHRDLHYNILMPDLHAHGLSEGESIGMGWNERFDVLHWAAVAEELFRCTGRASSMVIHGVSMGAATTMNVSGEELPNYIKGFIADCGYTSVWDEFACQLYEQFALPTFPLLYTTDYLCQKRYGWSFREASPLNQVERCTRPMFFIHGDNDRFVPTEMVHQLFAAKPDPKHIWIVPHTRHADSYTNYPEEYTRQVGLFLNYFVE